MAKGERLKERKKGEVFEGVRVTIRYEKTKRKIITRNDLNERKKTNFLIGWRHELQRAIKE